MKRLALAMMAAAAVVFGFGVVASAQNYGESGSISPNPPIPGGPYSAIYANCVAGELITFNQPQSTPATVTGTCAGAAPTLTGSIIGLVLPQQTALGTATGNFSAAPTAPGTYTGTASGPQSPQIIFQFTIPGQVTPTAAPVATTAPAPVPPTGLPATGSGGIGTTTGIALGLLAVGFGLFVVAQVRRRQSPGVA